MAEYVTKEQVIDWFSPYRHLDKPILFETLVSDLRGMKAADVEPVQEWISVKDRLPECEGSYIVYTERGSIYASHFYTEKRFASGYVREAQWSQRGTVKVTHWMPLPSTEGLK